MAMSVEEILRRFLLLGLPLIPPGCSGSALETTRDASVDLASPFDLSRQHDSADILADGIADMASLRDLGTQGDFGDLGYQRQDADSNVACPTHLGYSNAEYIVPRPSPDAGSAITIDAWNVCAGSGDCSALCTELNPSTVLDTCARVEADAGSDGAGGPIVEPGDPTAPTVEVHVAYSFCDHTGRRPEGLKISAAPRGGGEIGRWLAGVAALEAASVPAFRRLARELRAHGAPRRLGRSARTAAGDEVRHYVLTNRAARAHGVAACVPSVGRLRVRSLLEVAVENAREGCVRETFGAITAAYQSRHARDPRLRALMATIARDEARHAKLAWEIDAWARTALAPAGALAVSEARATAAAEIASELATALPTEAVSSAAGLPSPVAARALADRTSRLLWAA
jgi:hypothetical protein